MKQVVVEHRKAIAGFFAQLGDKQEWAVKGLLNRTDALNPPGSSSRLAVEARTPLASPGTQYFQEQRIKAHWERDLTFRLKEFRRRAATALSDCAEGFRERKALTSATKGTDAEIVLNWAFLLSPGALTSSGDAWSGSTEARRLPGLTLALTGPWPPHSFVPDLSPAEKV